MFLRSSVAPRRITKATEVTVMCFLKRFRLSGTKQNVRLSDCQKGDPHPANRQQLSISLNDGKFHVANSPDWFYYTSN